MIICSKCGKEIDGNEENCPHCGNDIDPVDIYNQWSNQESTKELHRQGSQKDNKSLAKKILVFLSIIIVIIIIVGIVILVSKKSNDVANKKRPNVLSDEYKPNINDGKKPEKQTAKVDDNIVEKDDNVPKDEKPKLNPMIAKYNAIDKEKILNTVDNADKALKKIIESYNADSTIIKGPDDMDYIQLNEEFNTKDKVIKYLKGMISSQKINEIMNSNNFYESDGVFYVTHGNIGVSMDIKNAKIINRNNTEHGINIKLSVKNSLDEDGNQDKDGILIFENDKLVVDKWNFL